jgi:hypothetical protein
MSSSAITGPIFTDVRRSPSGSAAAPSWSFNDSQGTGFYLVSANVLGLSTAGVQRVVVDASGNVGIGTASPNFALQLHTASASTARYLQVTNGSTGSTAGDGMLVGVDSSNDAICWMQESSALKFATSNTERMRLDASGNLLVNGTTSYGKTTIETSSGVALAFRFTGAAAGKRTAMTQDSSNTFYIFGTTGGVFLTDTGTSWGVNSDERMKKNIKPLELGLEQIKALKPARFDYNQDESESSVRVGFIAQEVLPVLPHAVHVPENSAQMMGVSATEMIPVLVKAIQELEARLAALESK